MVELERGDPMAPLAPRDRYAALSRCTYLNQAALGLIPVPTVDAMHAFVEQVAQFGNLFLSDEQEAAILDGVRSAGARLLGTSAQTLAVVGSASEGLGQVASLLAPDRGTVVLVASDFPSVTYPWLVAAQPTRDLAAIRRRPPRPEPRSRSRRRDRSDHGGRRLQRRPVRRRVRASTPERWPKGLTRSALGRSSTRRSWPARDPSIRRDGAQTRW